MTHILNISETVLIVLASGRSRRFGSHNKLLSSFRGNPLCSYSAKLDGAERALSKIAVIDGADNERNLVVEEIYKEAGWRIVRNMQAASGQASSLKTGLKAGVEMSNREVEAQAALVLLADMPMVDDALIEKLLCRMNECQANHPCHGVMCRSGETYMPPALFRKPQFSLLRQVQGDRGARQILQKIEGLASLECPSDQLIDIDFPADLQKYA